jgi:DNA-binding XRE family transcriptional regulator
MTIAKTLRRLREQSGRTATELAQAAGISRQALNMLESGQRQPSLETARKLMAALGKSLAELDEKGT